MNSIYRIACLFFMPISITCHAGIPDYWGEGMKQEDGSTVYSKQFEIKGRHWEPNQVSNYHIQLEYSRLFVAECNKGRVIWIDFPGNDEGPRKKKRTLELQRTKDDQITAMTLDTGGNRYVDLDGDGRIDIFGEADGTQRDMLGQIAINRRFIIVDDQIVHIRQNRLVKTQHIQTAKADGTVYTLTEGKWIKSAQD